tara:strand:+ start:186 stop:377 length:192 start_codon:yes stop_codon:yes gene_type:complete
MNNIFFRLLINIYKVQKLPIKRYSWEIEMKVLELNIELSDLLEKYEKFKKKETQNLKNNKKFN